MAANFAESLHAQTRYMILPTVRTLIVTKFPEEMWRQK
jgi:hypothetical protein